MNSLIFMLNKIRSINIEKKLKNKEEAKDYNLKMVKEIKKGLLNLKSFPSGNIIALNYKNIIIYDINFNEIQTIRNAHNDYIFYADIKDENNFVTCSDDLSIKTWIKKDGKYLLNKVIANAHSKFLNKVKYFSDTEIISCGYDGAIKIWKEDENSYQSSLIWKTNFYGTDVEKWEDDVMMDVNKIRRFYIIKDKQRFIIFHNGAIVILNLNNFEFINGYYGIAYLNIGELRRINDDLCAIDYAWGWANTGKIVILSLSEDKIIKEMLTPFNCHGMLSLIDKKILIIGGKTDIMLVNTNNFECFKILKNVHNDIIVKIRLLKNGMITTISHDKTFKIWSLETLDDKDKEKSGEKKRTSIKFNDNPSIMNSILKSDFYK